MKSSEITSLASAIRFLRHGDNPAERHRLTAILGVTLICIAFGVYAALMIIGLLLGSP